MRDHAIHRRYLMKKIEYEGWTEKLTDDHALHSGGKEDSSTTVGSLSFVITVKAVLVTV